MTYRIKLQSFHRRVAPLPSASPPERESSQIIGQFATEIVPINP